MSLSIRSLRLTSSGLSAAFELRRPAVVVVRWSVVPSVSDLMLIYPYLAAVWILTMSRNQDLLSMRWVRGSHGYQFYASGDDGCCGRMTTVLLL
jgi:hypothetical protein